jgi:organic radical activating enzyme
MIFVGLFLFIIINVVALNMFNSSNLQEIENHLKSSNCKNYIYTKGSYKAMCEDGIIKIENSFIIDLEKNSTLYNYKEIKNISVNKLRLVIDDKLHMDFNKEEELKAFHDALKLKLQE